MARASRPAYVVWSYRVPEGSKGGVGEAMELGVSTCAQGQDGARRRGSPSRHLCISAESFSSLTSHQLVRLLPPGTCRKAVMGVVWGRWGGVGARGARPLGT